MQDRELEARIAALEEQVAAMVQVTKALAATVVKERQRANTVENVVRVLTGDLPQQIVEKAYSSAMVGDLSLDMAQFGEWATEVTKGNSAAAVPDGLNAFTQFASGQKEKSPIPRT